MSNENKSVEENKIVEKKNDNKRKKIVFGIVFVFIILFVIILIFTLQDTKNEDRKESNMNSNENVDNHYNYDYKYVLETFFGGTCYIYLLNDDSVKTVCKFPVYEICEGTDCMKETGEYDYEETTIAFSDSSMKKVREFINGFFEKKLTNYVNLEKVDMNVEQQRMELAILLNNEDDITFEDDLIYQTETNQIKNSTGKVIFENKKTTIVANDNKIVQNIGNYLNAIVNEEWNKLNNDCAGITEVTNVQENEKYGIEYEIKLEEIGVYSYSFTYSMHGSLGGVPWNDYRGYVFDSTGEIKEFPNGFKDSTYEKAIEAFKKQDEYKDIEEELMVNWESVLKENMFNPGYWYIKDNKLIFTFPKTLISEFGPSSSMLTIEIENTLKEF